MSSDLIEASRDARAPVDEAPVVMPSVRGSRHRWAEVPAGGDGVRLQSLALKIAGDSRHSSEVGRLRYARHTLCHQRPAPWRETAVVAAHDDSRAPALLRLPL
jgi:hypothetical protein